MLTLVLTLLALPLPGADPPGEAPVCLVTDYGAVPDGETVSTAALQAAIDDCAERGGGTVWLPAGRFVSGTLHLRSRITLHLDAGAALLGSTDLADYPVLERYRRARAPADDPEDEDADAEAAADARARHFLLAEDVEDLALTGTGTIDGRAHLFAYDPETGAATPGRPLWWIRIQGARGVTVRDLTLRHSTGWTLNVGDAERVLIDGVRILNPAISPNTDGIDLRGVRGAVLTNLYIETGDDAICLKPGGHDNEDIVIAHSVLVSDHAGIKFGTGSRGGMRRVSVSNVVIRDTRYGIALFMRDGGVYEDLRFENVSISGETRHRTEYPVYVDIDRRSPDRPLGAIRRVTFRGLDLATRGNVLVGGQPEAPIEDLAFEDVRLRVAPTVDLSVLRKPQGSRLIVPDPAAVDLAPVAAHLTVGHVRGLHLRNVRVSEHGPAPEPRAALHLEGVAGAVLDGIEAMAETRRATAVRLRGVSGLVVVGARVGGYDVFLRGEDVDGEVAVLGSDLRAAPRPWLLPASARVRHAGTLLPP